MAEDVSNATIWRYLDFTRFVSLLDQSALFFPVAKLLQDPYEGGPSSLEPNGHLSSLPSKMETTGPHQGAFSDRELVLISSWHMSETESHAMWKIYGGGPEGLAIQSCVERLRKSIRAQNEFPIYVDTVKYRDSFESQSSCELPRFFEKLRPYEYEKEVRAVIDLRSRYRQSQLPFSDLEKRQFQELLSNGGLYINVDIDTLVERIVLSPEVPRWFSDLVASVLDRYNMKVPLSPSLLTCKGPTPPAEPTRSIEA